MSDYYNRLKEIVEPINEYFGEVTSNKTILPMFSIYMEKYLPKDIKREEFKLLYQVDEVYFFQVEYYTSVIDYDKNTNFSKSKSYGGYSIFDESKVILNLLIL